MSERYSYITQLHCPKCSKTYEENKLQNLCECGSPLLVSYDLEALKHVWKPSDLLGREHSLWRYHEVLPIKNQKDVVTLGEGLTPLIHMDSLGQIYDINQLIMKDEGLLPTGSFKARGAAVGVSKAKELGVEKLAMPTNGNAGAAWSLYSSRAGIESHIVMPVSAPEITRKEVVVAGGELYLIDGLISDAGHLVAEAAPHHDWFNVSTLKEPYRIEGKKTMGYELMEQLNWKLPDVIIYPTGGGVGLIGIYKALQEVKELGWIDEFATLPRLVAVQAEHCAPIVKAFDEGEKESQLWPESETVAFGINVPKALGDFLVLEAIRETNGCAIAITDEELLHHQRLVAEKEGVFICPEGGATFAAAEKLRADQWISKDETVICLNTGLGIKYPETVEANTIIRSKEKPL